MDIKEVQQSWDTFGQTDPMWAVLTYPDKMGNRWKPEEFFTTGREEVDQLLQWMKSLGAIPEYGRALDFGCGLGRLSQAIATHFAEVDGVDIAPSMLEQARQFNQHGERCRYHLNADADLHLFADQQFDFVMTLITLQHVEPIYSTAYLKEFLRVLKPKGLLVFQLPSEPTPQFARHNKIRNKVPPVLLSLYRQLRYGKNTVKHHNSMEMHSVPKFQVIELLQAHGGEIVEVKLDDRAGNWISYTYCVRKI